MPVDTMMALIGVVSAIGGAGGAWGAAHQRIKNTEADIEQVRENLVEHDLRTRGFSDRLVRIETLLESINRKIS